MADFVRRFERPRLPVVITGLCEEWPAAERWAVDRLLERFGDHKFKARVGVRRTGRSAFWLSPARGDAHTKRVSCFVFLVLTNICLLQCSYLLMLCPVRV